jgi:hypothetical protein
VVVHNIIIIEALIKEIEEILVEVEEEEILVEKVEG